MSNELLQLFRKKLESITDTGSQVDICRYFLDLEFFSSKVSDYRWLSRYVPKKYHNYLIKDFLNANPGKYSDLFFDRYSYDKYCWNLQNLSEIINSVELDDKAVLFADNIMNFITRNDEFFKAGLALFNDDEEIDCAAKRYTKTRN